MSQFIHFDEANDAAIVVIRQWLTQNEEIEALLVTDLFGKMRLVVFPRSDTEALNRQLLDRCGSWWTGEILEFDGLDEAGRSIFSAAYQTSRIDEVASRLRLHERHRTRTGWFLAPLSPPWRAPEDGPPIVVFYSFKGGLGRSTLLASFAIQRARNGERICIVDMDLDSPGAGRLLAADREGRTASWGAVDFLLEWRAQGAHFEDYWHRCDRIAGEGEVRVMPSGRVDARFADKLARVDLEETPSVEETGLWELLQRTRNEWKPDWILVDARTGISEPAGQLLSGVAHLHVLLGTFQDQSWDGLERVLDRLGKERILANKPQAEVLLVQAMVPLGEPGKWAREAFAGRAETSFEDRYYADSQADPDLFWTVEDKQGAEAPHVPVHLEYEARLASFTDVEDVADALMTGAYAEAGVRISNRFVKGEDT